jgi:hypothetical protein
MSASYMRFAETTNGSPSGVLMVSPPARFGAPAARVWLDPS